MKIGNLVRFKVGGNGRNMVGQVFRIDKQHYGSSTAYKISHVERGKCIRSDMVDFIGVTAEGIQDRVLVLWECSDWEYVKSGDVEVLDENR